MITSWRIVKAEYAADAFTGAGALEHAGRWHSAGHRMVYTSEHISLATLEILVHMRRRRFFPNYILVPCSFAARLVDEIDDARLPEGWFENPAPAELGRIGDEWIESRRSAVLRVPSATTRFEFNYLLNPEHEDFRSIEIGEQRPFHLDVRLL